MRISTPLDLPGGAQTEPCTYQDPGERSRDPTRDWPRLPLSVQSLWQRRGTAEACFRVGGDESSSACVGPFEGSLLYLHYLHHSLAPGQITVREHRPALQQKIGLKIYWAWPHPSEQDPVSPSVSLSHQEASISLSSFSIRGQTDWKPQSQKTNQSDHADHSLV